MSLAFVLRRWPHSSSQLYIICVCIHVFGFVSVEIVNGFAFTRPAVGAVQRFLCLQLLIDVGQSMSVELMLSDSEGGRMRALLSSATQRPEVRSSRFACIL